jgi:hypothetical protein
MPSLAGSENEVNLNTGEGRNQHEAQTKNSANTDQQQAK